MKDFDEDSALGERASLMSCWTLHSDALLIAQRWRPGPRRRDAGTHLAWKLIGDCTEFTAEAVSTVYAVRYSGVCAE